MRSQALTRTLKKLPDAPGVYFFLGKSKKILYIGRATSLRNRVRSYFDGRLPETRGPWLARMPREIRSMDFKKTDSVLEAIFLEADLIRKFQPPYNTDEKDDKSYNCVVITKEPFPQVLVARTREIDVSRRILVTHNLQLQTIHGPFPHGVQLREALKILRRIFPWRDEKCVPCSNRRHRNIAHADTAQSAGMLCKPCFNRQVGLCPGVCTGEMGAEDYRSHIRRLALFLSGKRSSVIRELKREMQRAAKAEEFEEAGRLKKTLFALQHVQDVSLLKRIAGADRGASFRIEAYDLSHFGGKEIVGAMTVVEQGVAKKSDFRLFRLRGLRGAHETEGLRELLRRRFTHTEWPFPELIVVDGNEVQKRTAEAVLDTIGRPIAVVAVVKDEKHRPLDIIGSRAVARKHKTGILLANSEAHRFALNFQKHRRNRSMRDLDGIKRDVGTVREAATTLRKRLVFEI